LSSGDVLPPRGIGSHLPSSPAAGRRNAWIGRPSRRPKTLYGALSVKADLTSFPTFLALPSGGAEPHLGIHGMDGPLLGRAERSSPKARRVAPLAARGLDGESASRAQSLRHDARGGLPSDWKPRDHTTTKSEASSRCERGLGATALYSVDPLRIAPCCTHTHRRRALGQRVHSAPRLDSHGFSSDHRHLGCHRQTLPTRGPPNCCCCLIPFSSQLL